MDVAAICRWLESFFSSRGLDFAVVGGFALVAHGIERATFDLDLVTLRAAQDDLIELLESRGYETLHRSSGYSNHLHRDTDLGRIDLVYVDDETSRRLFEGAQRLEVIEGLELQVLRPEHHAAMKVRAMKNDPDRKYQELADIRHLLRLPGVDRDEIRGYFQRLDLGHLYREITEDLD